MKFAHNILKFSKISQNHMNTKPCGTANKKHFELKQVLEFF